MCANVGTRRTKRQQRRDCPSAHWAIALVLDLEKVDEFKNADAYRALEVQIRDLNDQKRMLTKRRSELTAGYLNNG